MSSTSGRTTQVELEIDSYLAALADTDGSDLYLAVGALPVAKVAGELVPLGKKILSREDMRRLAAPLVTGSRAEIFRQSPEVDLAHEVDGKGRYRINVYRQRGHISVVARRIKPGVPTVEELGLPPVLKKLAVLRKGLLCVTGATGSGKSSTLAAMIDHRNDTTSGHILTIEDPIEFVHPHKASVVSQREVGRDTATFKDALRSALRQAPDLLLIGEIRDQETAEAALHFAETGHLVFATLHSTNAAQTIDRLVHLFPSGQAKEVYQLLSLNLAGVVSQRLIPKSVGDGRVPAIEILVPTARIRDLIKDGDIDGVKEAMADSRGREGLVSLDDALHQLVKRGLVSREKALVYADNAADLRVRFMSETKDYEAELARIRLA
ncbi:MAG: PilT/PilU family type 4a pilus ATPase [Planctomycetota bacterium]|jgi:twitching motility protein PilU